MAKLTDKQELFIEESADLVSSIKIWADILKQPK